MLARRRRENFDVFNLFNFNGFPFNFLQILKRKLFRLSEKIFGKRKYFEKKSFETKKKQTLTELYSKFL